MMLEEELAGSASVEIDPVISSFFQSPLSSPLGSGFFFFFFFWGGVIECVRF